MRCFRSPDFCTLLIILEGIVLSKPLTDRSPEKSTRPQVEEDLMYKREDVLRNVSLSQVPSQDKAKMKPPQFMMDLYNRYVTDKMSMPVSNIVRGFNAEDVLLSSSMEDSGQSHILLFNVSIPQHEQVTQAELKIYASLSENHTGHLIVYDVLHTEQSENLKDPNSFLESKEFEKSDWITIDVTKAVKRWIKSENEKNKLEVIIKTNSPDEHFPKEQAFDISGDNPPLLIVFSDDTCNRIKDTRLEIRDMILHEQESSLEMFSKNQTIEYEVEENEEDGERKKSFMEHKRRIKRGVKDNYCRKSSLIVNFKDIGWDSWLLGPPSYDAGECKGECTYPLTDSLTPTKHALLQTLMHQKYPGKIRKACCVPTKLESIVIIYVQQNGVVTIDNNYEGMKVAECGCR
ncbi:growth/differentiation factor 2 [Pelodytes ibericus]